MKWFQIICCCSSRDVCVKVTTLTWDSVKPRGGVGWLMNTGTRTAPSHGRNVITKHPNSAGQWQLKPCFPSERMCTSVTHQFTLGLRSLQEQKYCLLLRRYKGLHVTSVALEDQCITVRFGKAAAFDAAQLLEAFVQVARSSTPMTLSDWATVCTDFELRIFFLSSSSPRDPSTHYLEWERDTWRQERGKQGQCRGEKKNCMWIISLVSDKG